MLLKSLAGGAIFLFLIWLVAVLQGWSKSDSSGRISGVAFVLAFGAAAFWGLRVLAGWHHW